MPEVPRSLNYREEENQFRSLIPISNPEQMIAMNTFIKLHNIPLVSFFDSLYYILMYMCNAMFYGQCYHISAKILYGYDDPKL